jgi:DedD protein
MSKYFEETEREKSRRAGDTELTLGSGMLLTIFFGLVVLCGLCFGMGYALGSRGSKGPVFQSQPPAAGPSNPQAQPNSQQMKPSAAQQPPAAAQPVTASDQSVPGAPGAVPSGQGEVPGAPAATNTAAVAGGPAAGQPVAAQNGTGWHPVQAAIAGGTGAMQGAQATPASAVRPAMPGQGNLMVQIAALSNQEDAGVLIGALRRRGYTVSAVRSPADNLIHVCIGPFSNRMDANSMRQKLLSDGYNAVVLP